MSQENNDTGELNKKAVVVGLVLVANDDTPEVLQMREEALDFPSTLASA